MLHAACARRAARAAGACAKVTDGNGFVSVGIFLKAKKGVHKAGYPQAGRSIFSVWISCFTGVIDR